MYPFSPINIVSALEEQMIHEFPYDDDDLFANSNLNETDTSHNSTTSSPQLQGFNYNEVRNPSIDIERPASSVKTSSHNEYERGRRKKLNKLYSSLGDLLPEKDQIKKLSIPCSIARVLKYIPELKRNIEKLIQKKEELLLRAIKDEIASTYPNNMVNPIISATCLSKTEIMIQICSLNTGAKILFSKVSKILEREGFDLMNATTHTTSCDRTFYSLHLQARETMKLDGQILCEKLMGSLSEANNLQQESNKYP